MKIQKLNTQNQKIQFKANPYVKQMTMPITDTKVCKNLTQIDKNTFVSYVFAKQFSFSTTEKEIQELFKLQGENFLEKAYKFLANKLNIDEKILPTIQKNIPEDPNPFSYISKNNTILIAPNIEEYPNIQIFACLRHELQHFQQNVLMLRDDEIGEKLPTIYAKKLVNDLQDNTIALLEKSSFEELSKKVSLTPEQAEFYKTCDTFIKNDDVDGFIEFFEPLYNVYINEWNKIRDIALEKYGPLTPKEKIKAQSYFKDFFNIKYYNEDDTVNLAKHMTTAIELEANVASDYAIHQMFSKDCYFKTLKNQTLDLISSENEDTKKLLDDIIKETRNKQD